MTTYLKKLDIPALPDELNQFFKMQLGFLVNNFYNTAHISYGGFSQDKNSLNYVDENEHLDKFGEPGTVSFFVMPNTPQLQKLWFFTGKQDPWFRACIKQMAYQTIGPGTHVPPHIDDSKARKYGIIYLLDPGGDNVITRWYKKKKEAEHLPIDEGMLITYKNLECVYEHKLEPYTWYIGDYSQIHSIENLTRMRTAIGIVVKPGSELPI